MRVRLLPLCLSTFLLLTSSAAFAQYGGTPPPSQPAPSDGFESGGLAPPPPVVTDPSQPNPGYQTETQRKLDESESEDSGRGLEWFYLNVEGGYQYIGLETFKSDGLTYAKTVNTTDGGLMLGAGAGIRLIFLTFGARARVGMFSQWNLATLDGELGVHIPLGAVEPYFNFAAGYAFLGSMDASNWGGDVTIRGWNARAGVGLDYYVTPVFSIGANLTGEALFLARPGVTLDAAATGSTGSDPAQLDAASQEAARADGSGVGASVTTSAVLGLHF